MNLVSNKQSSTIADLKIIVVGHVEWMSFLKVEKLPKAGHISHGSKYFEEPAGGGAVVALQIARLLKRPVHFFTAVGRDEVGEKCARRLEQLGLKLSIAWRDSPTRRGISMVNSEGERAITVIGKRLQPEFKDDLPWNEITNCDGVFVSAADKNAFNHCRSAKILVVTPRLGKELLKQTSFQIDALIGSGLDPDEQISPKDLKHRPLLHISTEGSSGGKSWPGGRYKAMRLNAPLIDSYGCGDSFAAGVTAGLAAGMDTKSVISLGAKCGADCATHFGPYP